MDPRNGYTITELMLAVAILGILSSVGFLMMRGFNNFYLIQQAQSDIQRDARASLNEIDQFLRQGKASTIVISSPAGAGPYSEIQFTGIDGKSYAYYQAGRYLIQLVNGNRTVLSHDLEYIAFTFPESDDNTIISVSLTMGETIWTSQQKLLELTIEKVRVMNP